MLGGVGGSILPWASFVQDPNWVRINAICFRPLINELPLVGVGVLFA